MFRRKYGFTITLIFKCDGHVEKETPHIRCWTKGWAQYYANRWLDTFYNEPGWTASVEVKELPPVINYYADKYWNSNNDYIGPK